MHDPPFNDLVHDCRGIVQIDRDRFFEIEMSFYAGTTQAEMTAVFDAILDSVNATGDPPTAR